MLARASRAASRSFSSAATGRIAAPVLDSGDVRDGLIGSIGNTPLIRLNKISEETGCEVLGKAEFLNPGGSVKDRAALYLVKDAEDKGLIGPGGTVVEGTAGNTGIGLAHVCNARGYKCVIYMPDTQSEEKKTTLRVLGAEVRPVPAVPFTDPNNFNHLAKDYADSLDNAVWTNQFDNTANRQAHVETTGPEIWAQTKGKVDAFVCATGTGGTLAGVSQSLKHLSDGKTKIFLADPPGSVLYSWVSSGGKSMERDGSSITEGIGQGRLTDNLEGTELDGAVRITDDRTIAMTYSLLATEGIFLGASSCLNVVAAYDVAKMLGPGHTITTVMCDGAARYQSRLFSKSWLESKGLYEAVPEEYRHFVAFE